jgi:hypothetical protein
VERSAYYYYRVRLEENYFSADCERSIIMLYNMSTMAPWLQAIVRFLEIMFFAGLAGGVDWMVTYFQTAQGGFSPLFISIAVAALASLAKYARGKAAQAVEECAEDPTKCPPPVVEGETVVDETVIDEEPKD